METRAAAVSRQGPFSAEAVAEAARELRLAMGAPAPVAFAFCSPDYIRHLEEFCEILRVDGHIVNVAGCPALGPICETEEFETRPGFSVLALALPGGGDSTIVTDAPLPSDKPCSWIALTSPDMANLEAWVQGAGSSPVVGGIASSPVPGSGGAVFLNGRLHECLAVEVPPPTRCVPVLCQGCRPIGEPLTVTRAENNVIYALGAKPAYEALESAFETLSEAERASARGNLFAGLAGSEYVEEYHTGDFLVRHILGADPNSGAVAIAGMPRIGQTLQYQLRDAQAASREARKALTSAQTSVGRPAASLLFSCTARGRAFFGAPGHDAGLVQEVLGPHPSAGLACAGELAPLWGRNGVHSHSLVCANFYPPPAP